jgi:hypothetical protein
MNKELFDKACDALKAKDYKAAERAFKEVMKSLDEHHVYYNRVASHLGLAQVLISDRNGLLLCRDAASSETVDGDVFLNLACAEWHTENRKRAIDAVIRGRKIDATHEQLGRASMLLDSRRRNVFPFLSRQHFLNRIVGRTMRRARDEITVHSLLY